MPPKKPKHQRTPGEVLLDGKRMTTRLLTDDEILALEEWANREDRSVSWLMARIIRERLTKEARR